MVHLSIAQGHVQQMTPTRLGLRNGQSKIRSVGTEKMMLEHARMFYDFPETFRLPILLHETPLDRICVTFRFYKLERSNCS